MTQLMQICVNSTFRKYRPILLALFWSLGYFCGILFFSGSLSFSLMPVIVPDHLSIIELFFSSMISFLLFAFAVYISQPLLLLLFSFLHTAVVSFVFSAVALPFGDAGWLFGCIFCFHIIMLLPVLWWYAYHNVFEPRFHWGVFFLILTVCVTIALIEHYFIIPFTGDMFDYWKG